MIQIINFILLLIGTDLLIQSDMLLSKKLEARQKFEISKYFIGFLIYNLIFIAFYCIFVNFRAIFWAMTKFMTELEVGSGHVSYCITAICVEL